MVMSMVLDPAQMSVEKQQIQGIVEDIAGTSSAVRWRYSAYSNERFPLRAYASALRGSGPDADEILVIVVTWRNARNGKGDRLIIAADILDEDGVILAESPRFEVPLPDESAALNSSHRVFPDLTDQVRGAMLKITTWLDSQTSTIQDALSRAA